MAISNNLKMKHAQFVNEFKKNPNFQIENWDFKDKS